MNNQNKQDNKIKLQRVLFYGRTLEEYLKMFDLDLSLWKDDKILDCPYNSFDLVLSGYLLFCYPKFVSSFLP